MQQSSSPVSAGAGLPVTPFGAVSSFEAEVLTGLRATPKTLPSKYFYDRTGDELFQQIMSLPEYYLTQAELQLLQENAAKLLDLFSANGGAFNLLELGAGDGHKTKVLLRHFLQAGAQFTYVPVDISENAVTQLAAQLQHELPDLNTRPVCLDFFQGLPKLTENSGSRNVVLFLGSSIGNMNNAQATVFLRNLGGHLQTGDLFLTGFDLVKDPATILAAYNDVAGVTADFNLNLLQRMNTELGTDFDTTAFRHFPVYDPVLTEARSYLVSTKKQSIFFPASEETITFAAWEPIHTEISRKYTPADTDALAFASGFKPKAKFSGPEALFLDALWEKI